MSQFPSLLPNPKRLWSVGLSSSLDSNTIQTRAVFILKANIKSIPCKSKKKNSNKYENFMKLIYDSTVF